MKSHVAALHAMLQRGAFLLLVVAFLERQALELRLDVLVRLRVEHALHLDGSKPATSARDRARESGTAVQLQSCRGAQTAAIDAGPHLPTTEPTSAGCWGGSEQAREIDLMHLSKEVLYLLSASVLDHHIVALELGVELQRDFALSNTVATCVSMQRAQLHFGDRPALRMQMAD
jgi:hypothetical protein